MSKLDEIISRAYFYRSDEGQDNVVLPKGDYDELIKLCDVNSKVATGSLERENQLRQEVEGLKRERDEARIAMKPQWKLNVNTQKLISDFMVAVAEKLRAAEIKYGFSDDWMKPDWKGECESGLQLHLEKGDPIDVAAYCAFMWYHKWSTSYVGEEKLLKLVDERDVAENALSEAYMLITGNYPEWSNNFGYNQALCAFKDAQVERNTLAKTSHLLRKALESLKDEFENYVDGAPDANHLSKLANHVVRHTIQALATPSLTDLVVLTREELEKFDCSCRLDADGHWHWELGDMVRGKCPRCQRLEEMEKK